MEDKTNEAKKPSVPVNIQTILDNLSVRTMADDLKKDVPASAFTNFQKRTLETPAQSASSLPQPKETPPVKPQVPPAAPPQKEIPKIVPSPPSGLPTVKPIPFDQILSTSKPPEAPPSIVPSPPKPAPVVPSFPPISVPQPTMPPKPEMPQPQVVYKQAPSVIQPLTSKPAAPTPSQATAAKPPRKALKAGPFIIILATLAIITAAILAYIFLIKPAWIKPQAACPQGKITESCVCNKETKDSGSCCANQWIANDCSSLDPPKPLISLNNESLVIDAVKKNDYNNIIGQIKNLGSQINQENLSLIALKIADAPTQYANFEQLAEALKISLPDAVKQNIADFNLLLFTEPASPTNAQKNLRLVLILKQKNPEMTAQLMTAWEPTMVKDLTYLLLDTPGKAASDKFLTRLYNNGTFRYVSQPNYTLTINYTIQKDYLIIGTSRESIFYVYDLIAGNK